MKPPVFLIMLILISSPAIAEELPDIKRPYENKWTWGDTALQGIFIGLSAVDRYQTAHFDHRICKEVGWAHYFIGEYPTSGQINRYFLLGITLHMGIAIALPKYVEVGGIHIPVRNIWQSFWIGVEANATYNNYQLGLQYRFF